MTQLPLESKPISPVPPPLLRSDTSIKHVSPEHATSRAPELVAKPLVTKVGSDREEYAHVAQMGNAMPSDVPATTLRDAHEYG